MSTSYSSNHDTDDLQHIQRQIHEKQTGILESTRRMRGLVYESEAIGTGTAAVSLHSLSLSEIGERWKIIFRRTGKSKTLIDVIV